MRRLTTILLAMVVIPVMILAGLLAIANTPPGARLIERMIARSTGGTVQLEHLAGRFPDAVRIGRVTVADGAGVWLRAGDIALDWSPLTLLTGQVLIDRLTAGTITIDRSPASSGGDGQTTAVPAGAIVVRRLGVARLTMAAAVTGAPAVLCLEGNGRITPGGKATMHLAATAPRPGRADRYLLDGSLDGAGLHTAIDVLEGPGGLLATLSGLPDLGQIVMAAATDGPMDALRSHADIEAGQLKAMVDGTVNVPGEAADLSVSLKAPPMTPGPGIAWAGIDAEATIKGPIRSPEARGTLSVDAMTMAGARFDRLRASISGQAGGDLALHGTVEGLRVPGPNPDLFAAAPLVLDVTPRLAATGSSVRFVARHPLFAADGDVDGDKGALRLTVPDLRPLAVMGGLDLSGPGRLRIDATWPGRSVDLSVSGDVAATGGARAVQALIGDHATFSLTAALTGDDITLNSLAFSGRAIRADAAGQWISGRLGARWSLALSDIGALHPGASGTITAAGHAEGPMGAIGLTADLSGEAIGEAGHLEHVKAHVDLAGLPGVPTGHVIASGELLGAPIDAAIAATHDAGGLHVLIDRATWKSLSAAGALDFADGAVLPSGEVTIDMARLADLPAFSGHALGGALHLSASGSPASLRVTGLLERADLASVASVRKASLDATLTDPAGTISADGALTLDDWAASGLRGSGRLTVRGPADALAITVAGGAAHGDGAPARLDAAGILDTSTNQLSLSSLRLDWRGEVVRLLAPARIGFVHGVELDGARIGFRKAELALAGGWDSGQGGRGIDARVTLKNLPADVVALFAPEHAMDGTIAAEARLSGEFARPDGSVRISANGIKQRTGAAAALPAANGAIVATLAKGEAKVDGKVAAGSTAVTVTGLLPLDLTRPMALQLGGTADLSMINPLTLAGGRSVAGHAGLAVRLDGPVSAPKARGTITLSGGAFRDSILGIHIDTVHGAILLDGDTVRLPGLMAMAGTGTLTLSGGFGLSAGPSFDLALKAVGARIFATDPLTATTDADLTLRGALSGPMQIAGSIRTLEVDILVPERLPAGIAVIPVREPGVPPPPPSHPAAVPDIGLAVHLHAQDRIYVRGKGVDAELAGDVSFSGTTAHPVPRGGLKLRRGTVSLAGQVLTLTEGTIDFSAGALTSPSLRLVASSTTGTTVATLTVTGEVGNPKIVLSSVPDLPPDEILAQLLFHTASARLSPLQLAQIAGALAELSGHGSPLGDKLDRLRSTLGLDQLSVGSDAAGGATLQAGRYLLPGVRVVASQGASGESKATVQIDLGKGLKLESSVATGSTAASGTGGGGSGTSVGVTYQFEY
jgi:translocation and assembly module TamB